MKVIGTLFSFLVYLAIGGLFHLMLIGDKVDYSSLTSWVTIIAWPFVMMLVMAAFALAIGACIIIWIIGGALVDGYKEAGRKKSVRQK